jgi:4-hydroxybenzoate polyprenyltransferase
LARPPTTRPSTVDSRSALADLVRSCHPQPAFAVTAVSGILAWSLHRGIAGTAAVIAAVLAGQLSVGWSNDYLDAARDAANHRADKPVAAGRVTPATVRTAAFAALLATVPLSLLSGWLPGLLHIAAVLSAWSYNLWLKFSALSVLPYLVSFALLPAFVARLPAPGWLVVAGSLLGASAHFANVLPDLAADLATGVRGLPHRIGRRGSQALTLLLLLAATLVIAVYAPGLPTAVRRAAPAVAFAFGVSGLLAGRRAGSRAPFGWVIAMAGIDVVLLLFGAN